MTTEWPFQDSPHSEALASARVMDGDPVLLVTHDAADGGWQFLCGSTDRAIEVRDVELGTVISKDPSLRELADLPVGWRAWRSSPEDPWRRAPLGLGP
jgi:hypothetical protein